MNMKRILKSYSQRRVLKGLFRNSVFLIVLRMMSKVLLFGFTLTLARYLSQKEFGDFQFILSFINIFVCPMIIITMVVARLGCSYTLETQMNNLRWLWKRGWLSLSVLFGFTVILSYFLDPWLIQFGKIESAGSGILAGIFIGISLFFYYGLGILQAIESFIAIGWLLLFGASVTFVSGLVVRYLGLNILYGYLAQIIGLALSLLAMFIVIQYKLPSRALQPGNHKFSVRKFSFLMLISVGSFFLLYNMDILASRIWFDRVDAGYYARLELIGKISFVLSSSIGLIIFPRVSKLHEKGEDPSKYLIRGSLLYFVFSAVTVVLILVFYKEIFAAIFGSSFVCNNTILLLILIAKTFQAYIFILINYEAAVIDRRMVFWVMGILAAEGMMFLLYHGSLQQIPVNIMLPSIVGTVLLLRHVLMKNKNTVYATNKICESSQ